MTQGIAANQGSRGTFPGEPVAAGPPPTIPPTAVLTLRRSGLLVRGTLAKGEAGCLEEKVAAWLTDPKRERHRRRRPTPFLLSMPSALLPCRTGGLSELRRGTRAREFFHCWVHQASARAGKHSIPFRRRPSCGRRRNDAAHRERGSSSIRWIDGFAETVVAYL